MIKKVFNIFYRIVFNNIVTASNDNLLSLKWHMPEKSNMT